MHEVVLKEYWVLMKNILYITIQRTKKLQFAALVSFILTFISTYFLVRMTDYMSLIVETLYTNEFEHNIKMFLVFSMVGLVFKYIPRIFYTIVMQLIVQSSFVHFLREHLSLDYTVFHSKTPGELRYIIFLKSYASTACSYLVVFESATLLGSSIFSFIKIYNEISSLSAIILLFLPIGYFWIVWKYILMRLEYQYELLLKKEETSSRLYDRLLNCEIIRTYNLESQEANGFYRDLSEQTKTQTKLGLFESKGTLLFRSVLIVPYILVVLLAIIVEKIPNSSLFKFTLFYLAISGKLIHITTDITSLMLYINQIQFSNLRNPEGSSENLEITEFKKSIEWKNVTMYHGEKQIIRNINLVINKKEKIAIVGPNGTGKSTFVKSLLGFVKMDGDILIDGTSMRKLLQKSVLKLISYIPQDDFTSDDTIMNNLRLGLNGASDEYIYECARKVGADDLFRSLPDGYEMEVGPRGNRLSGGQKQKLSLVRAIIKDAPIFILDEATASMDKSSENELIGHLFSILEEKTVIVIIHGKEHLRKFDKIVFLNEEIVEDVGTYEDLIFRSEKFRNYAVCDEILFCD